MDMPTLSMADQAELQRLEESMWRQALRFDLRFREERFASDFFEFGRSGRVYNRAQAIRTDSHPIAAAAEYDGVMEYARRSSIWYRSPTGWVMRFHQGTAFEP
jgi:hypothetical protein